VSGLRVLSGIFEIEALRSLRCEVLGEEPILCDVHGRGASFVIVSHMIDPTANGIALHRLGVVGPQQFRDRCDILHSGSSQRL
jgi:hypothetical protein